MFSEMCPPVTLDSLEITCTLNGEPADCKKSSVPGTKLKPKCKPHHALPNGQLETPIQLQCRNDGKWFGGKLYTCVQKNCKCFLILFKCPQKLQTHFYQIFSHYFERYCKSYVLKITILFQYVVKYLLV